MKHPGIYLIKSISNPNKQYVGSSYNVHNRITSHKRSLLKNKHRNSKLQNHYNKYGLNDLVFELLEQCKVDELIEYENYWYYKLKPFFCILTPAQSCIGTKQTKETKNKRSKAIKNYYANIITDKERKRLGEDRSRLMSAYMKSIRVVPKEYKLYYINELDKRDKQNRLLVECICMLCGVSHERIFRSLVGMKTHNKCCIREEKRYKAKVRKERYEYIINHNYKSKVRSDNTTGFAGVVFDKGANKYRARIKHKGKLLTAGKSTDLIECVKMRNKYIIDNDLPHAIQSVDV